MRRGIATYCHIARRLAVLVLLAAGTAQAATPTLAELEQATRLNPRSAEAWDRYGQALARQGRYSEAQTAFAKALEYALDARHVLHHVALAHAWSGNYKEAARRFAALVARYPYDAELRLDYGQTLAWDRRYPQARQQYEAVLARRPRHVEALRHLGILAAWENKYDEALALLARAAEQEPRNLRVLLAQGDVLSWKGDLARAAQTLEQAHRLAPKDAGVWLQLAQVQLWQGRLRDAQDSYRAVLELDPRNLEAHLGLVRSYREQRDYREAEKVLRAAQALYPGDARIGKELAALAAQRRPDLGTAVEFLEPLLFVAVLLTIFYHLHRYRRVLPRRAPTINALLVVLPLLAIATLVTLAFILWGGAYYREVQLAWSLLELLGFAIFVAVTFTLVWLLRFERPSSGQTVLAIGAHPDDIEFGCGATLLRYREQGCRTHGLVLSGGEQGHPGNDAGQHRAREARASANVLALDSLEQRELPDTRLSEHREALRIAIEDALARLKPDIIFTHTDKDAHSDHRAVFEATREAARGAYTILCYENPNTPASFSPDYFVDVSEYLDDKIAALARHKSQRGKPYADPAVVRHSAGFRGTQARVTYAEAFEAVRVLEKRPSE